MPQGHTPAEIKAEASSEETKQFVRRVRRVTRRKFSPEEKVRVVLEGFRAEVKVSELCRREGDPSQRLLRPAEGLHGGGEGAATGGHGQGCHSG